MENEVVFCKECKHKSQKDRYGIHGCFETEDEPFCKDGARRPDAKEVKPIEEIVKYEYIGSMEIPDGKVYIGDPSRGNRSCEGLKNVEVTKGRYQVYAMLSNMGNIVDGERVDDYRVAELMIVHEDSLFIDELTNFKEICGDPVGRFEVKSGIAGFVSGEENFDCGPWASLCINMTARDIQYEASDVRAYTHVCNDEKHGYSGAFTQAGYGAGIYTAYVHRDCHLAVDAIEMDFIQTPMRIA